jgi:predicted unusual protein kinase regulating ubiquinone biosynthesis (AarF/ABC1/UbiB family)
LLISSLDEVELRLREEVDYCSEANNTEWFRAHLKIKAVVIPKVHRQLSSKRVLTTQRLQGQHLEEWLQGNPCQTQRNIFAQQIYDTFVQSFYGLHALNADPNPGNYLFCENRQLGLLDFGCVRHFSPRFIELMPKLMRAYQDENAQTILDLYADIGILSNIPEEEIQAFYDDYLKPFGDWITQPFKTESFDFGDLKKPSAGDALKSVSHMAANTSFESMASEFIFFNRTYFGICNIFERMHATVRMHHQWLQADSATQTADEINP